MVEEDQSSNEEKEEIDESRNNVKEFAGNEVTPTKEDKTSRKIDFHADDKDDKEADERLNRVL